ncbi:ComEA family DNA-binding protein [Citricoccus sp.]|uniref:ComEA family DNA-binding protein n=1 Tax=Citricoccus sp. TaxID=1978372 RepID=UPI002CE1F77E|nr:ComEA family DNA-binding protein [Citricoccus sp.]HRO94445.1 ComEA family DNA-binding protein [Citricoccus sp.]
MGRHSQDDTSVTGDWEQPPPVAPLWRGRVVTSAVLLLAVLAATWWAVSWLISPAGPTGTPAPQAAALENREGHRGRDAEDAEQRAGTDRGPSSTAVPGPPEAGRPGVGPSSVDQDDGTAGTAPGAVIVHVAGEVHEPGLVELPPGSRVADALHAAGGSTTRARLDLLNLAAPAVDASQILVPGPDTPLATGGTEPGDGPGRQPVNEAPGEPGSPSGTVNVNTADAAELEQLPGIGPALAGRIVDHREQVGPYGSLEDLDAVSGIGPAMMERLDGLVSW